MKFHPYAETFDLIQGAEFEALINDIKANGLREKIWTLKGQILDGRNRFIACKKAGVKPEFRPYKGNDPLSFVISANIHRRHLDASQRALIAARIAKLGDGERKSASPIGEAAVTQQEAAELLNVGKRSVERARKVLDEGSKELQKAVASSEVAVSKAAAVVDLPKSEQLKAAKQKQEPPKPIEVTPAPDFDFTDYEPEDDDAYRQNIENVMMADDKLLAMREELKQLHREIRSLKESRDHYQNQAGAAARLVKVRDKEIDKLKKTLEKALEENDSLRERVAIMEAA